MKNLLLALFIGCLTVIALNVAFLLTVSTVKEFKYTGYYKIVQALPNLPNFNTGDLLNNTISKQSALIRLHKDTPDEKERFYCSGFVISDVYAVTAAHCLYDGENQLDESTIYIHNPIDKRITTAGAVALNVVSDLGLIRGDFTKFNKLKVDPSPDGPFRAKGQLVTCGFPYGDAQLCTPFFPREPRFVFIGGGGYIYPGMSGGPVIDIPSMTVIGVNSSISDGSVNIAPLIGLFYAAKVKVQ